jgi:hypothetical protein
MSQDIERQMADLNLTQGALGLDAGWWKALVAKVGPVAAQILLAWLKSRQKAAVPGAAAPGPAGDSLGHQHGPALDVAIRHQLEALTTLTRLRECCQ